jgi:hypothetical protein
MLLITRVLPPTSAHTPSHQRPVLAFHMYLSMAAVSAALSAA